MFQVLGLFVTLVLSIQGALGEETSCSGKCNQNQEVQYRVGHTYVYNYNVESFAFINISNYEGQINKVGLSLAAEAELYILSPCEIVMTIVNASLKDRNYNTSQGSDGELSYGEFSTELTKNKIHLHYDNGKIVGVCSHQEEQAWVMNIKKGIVSMLQFQWSDGTDNYTAFESDIHGICKSQYSMEESDNWKLLRRKRYLNDCTHRGGASTPIVTSFFPLEIFKNIQVCKYVLGDTRQPVMVTCKERHRLHPHYTKGSIALANITQQLNLDRIIIKGNENEQSMDKDVELRKENLFFDFHYNERIIVMDSLMGAMEQLVTFNDYSTIVDIMNTNNFISLLKNASYEEIMTVFNKFEKNDVQIALQNCLSHAQSAESIKVVMELTKQNNMSSVALNKWFMYIQLIKNPSKEMLINLQSYIGTDLCSKNRCTGISTLVNAYCRTAPNCTEDPAASFFINYWDSQLQLYPSKVDHKQLLHALIAIGNIGLTNAGGVIRRMIKDTSLDLDLRVAAIQALRKAPCSSIEDLKEVFKNSVDNTEIRIMAYINAIKCPSTHLLENVLFQLQFEELNSVTTFVWDHLRKTKKIPEEWKDNITDILNDEFFKAKYQSYIENSAGYFENYNNYSLLNMSAVANGVTLYRNRVPWSSLMKLSLSIFDNEVDNVEISVNIRDIDSVIESLFPSKELAEVNEYILKNGGYNEDNSIPVNEPYYESDRRFSQYGGYITFRFLNNEFVIVNTSDILARSLGHFMNCDIRKVIGHNSFKNGFNFDRRSSYFRFPTGVGFPLEYNMTLDGNVNYNLDNFISYKDSQKFKFDMDLNLSGKLETMWTTSVVLDGHVTKKGLEGTINANFDVNLKNNLNIESRKLTGYKFDIPKDHKLFTVSSNLEVIH